MLEGIIDMGFAGLRSRQGETRGAALAVERKTTAVVKFVVSSQCLRTNRPITYQSYKNVMPLKELPGAA